MDSRADSLAAAYPELAAQWHPERNGSLTPADVVPSCRSRVWWLGPCGHEWETSPETRRRGSGCPYCSGALAVPGENDLATTYPALAAQWHPERNGGLSPSDVKETAKRPVWWRCPDCGFEWESPVKRRSRGAGCPRCAEKGFPPAPPERPDPDLGWWKALLARAPLSPGGRRMLAVCRAKTPEDVRRQLSALTSRGWVLLGMRGFDTRAGMERDAARGRGGGAR